MLPIIPDHWKMTLAAPRNDRGHRLTGFVLALLAEAALMLVVLSMGWMNNQPKSKDMHLVSVAMKESTEPAKPKPEQAASPTARPAPDLAKQQPAAQAVTAPAQPTPPASPPAIIPVSRDQLAKFDLSNLPRQPAAPAPPGKGMMGPPNLGVPGDSKRVGTAPNGQPMYAAAWYREPYHDELAGYLSTAQGPGWALIACRTAPDFRVEACVGLDEYPDGSQIQRAVLAAAWQFRVRPPRIGGVSQVGEWVRIRIDYTEQRSR